MKKLYTPDDESELLFLKSLFEAEEIPFFVLNDHFGSLYSGAYVSRFNAKTITVPEEFYEDARELILSVKENAVFEDEQEKGGRGQPGFFDSLLGILGFGRGAAGARKKGTGKDE